MPSIFNVVAQGSSISRAIDEVEVRRALAVLPDPEHGWELLALPSKRNWIGASTDEAGALQKAKEFSGEYGVYWLTNPIRPDERGYANAEKILKRRWLLVDIDPVKHPDHGHDNATDAEKEATRQIAERVMDYLDDRGWPVPVLIDSGNGWHLLYRIDLPHIGSGDESHQLIKRVLKSLGRQFSGPGGTIDEGTASAKVHSKLPGTWVAKGKISDDRPARQVWLANCPAEIQLVSRELLEAEGGPPEAPKPQPPNRGFRLLRATNGDDQAYARAAFDGEVARVEMAVRGFLGGDGCNRALTRAAFSLGTLIVIGLLSRSEVEHRLLTTAVLRGLTESESRGAIRRGIEAGMKCPRQIAERVSYTEPPTSAPPGPAPSSNGHHEEPKPTEGPQWQFTLDGEVVLEGSPIELLQGAGQQNEARERVQSFDLYSLPGLLAAVFPEPQWVVPGLLSEGLNILAGKPKHGKSLLALNLAITIAGGGQALRKIAVEAGDVLYLSLEDKCRRLQARARKMLKTLGCEANSRLVVATYWPRQHEGGLDMLDVWREKARRPTLFIIDVWTKFRPPIRQGGSLYDQDYNHMTAVKDYADRHSINALVIHHTRKGASEDVVEEISGSLGQAGAADGLLVLKRSRSDNEAKVFITGRDVADHELALRFDPESLTWESLGAAEDYVRGKLQKAIIQYLKDRNGEPCFASDIAQHLNETADKIRPVLHRLFDKRILRRQGQAWCYPGEGASTEEIENEAGF